MNVVIGVCVHPTVHYQQPTTLPYNSRTCSIKLDLHPTHKPPPVVNNYPLFAHIRTYLHRTFAQTSSKAYYGYVGTVVTNFQMFA